MSKWSVSVLAAAAAVMTTLAVTSNARADVFQATSNSQCLANVNGRAALQPCSLSRHNNNIRYIAQENVFYGTLQQGGRCLDIQNNHVLFANCNGSKSQVWKFAGSGQLNNEMGWCVVGQGGSVAVSRCPAAGAWLNATYKAVQVPNMAAVPRGTPLKLSPNGRDIVDARTGQMVAAGGGNVLPSGAGNMVAAGGGNMVAAGGGNVIIGRNAARMVAAGGGN